MTAIQEKLKRLCKSDFLDHSVEKVVTEMNLEPTQKSELSNYVRSNTSNLDSFVQFLRQVKTIRNLDEFIDPEELMGKLEQQLMYFWIHYQSEWIIINNKINFELMTTGELKQLDSAKAYLASLLAGEIEQCMKGRDIKTPLNQLQQFFEGHLAPM